MNKSLGAIIKLPLYYVSFILLTGFTIQDPQRKLIRQDGYNLEFYVWHQKEVKVKEGRKYFWYKSGEVHKSFSDYGGDILHGEFIKSYLNNNLAEKGLFSFGLKKGEWKTWYENGNLNERIFYKNGIRQGYYEKYTSSGKLEEKGTYKKGVKKGLWIERGNDTITYDKGRIQPVKVKISLLKRLQKLFKNKESKLDKKRKKATDRKMNDSKRRNKINESTNNKG